VGTFVKYGSLREEKFKQQVQDIIIFRSTYKLEESDTPKVEVQTEGDAWKNTNPEAAIEQEGYTTLKAYLERNKERHENRVFYCTDSSTQATYVQLYKNQGVEVLFMDSFIDNNYFVPFLEREYADIKFTRVDAELDSTLLEQDKAAEIVDPATNKTRSDVIKELFEKALNDSRINVRVESLKADDPQGTPPAMVLLPEAMRRLQEMTALMQQQAMAFPESHVLVVNSAHPLIQNILQLNQGTIIQGAGESPSGELAKALCLHVYDLALMAQKGFTPEGMKSFVERSNRVLTQLTQN
jgi:molecular chaperone HtpG